MEHIEEATVSSITPGTNVQRGLSPQSTKAAPPPAGAQLAFDPIAWQHIADPIWVYDLSRDRIVWANPEALAFWRAETLEALQSRSFASNSDVAKTRLRDYADRIGSGETFETPWTFYPGGVTKTARCRCSGVPLDDGRTGLLSHVVRLEEDSEVPRKGFDHAEILRNARDELARAEARFRTFAEAGSDWLWETDEQHRFIYFSSSVQDHFVQTFRDMIGRTRHDVMAEIGAEPDDYETQQKWDRHAATLAAHEPFRDLRYRIRNESGKIRYSSISGDPIFDETGTFRGYRGVARNVTDTIEAERHAHALERERDLAVTSKTVMNRFLATMSHELRTPLNAIIGFSEIMSREIFGSLGNKVYRDYSEDILGSARHLLSIVEDLLGLSRFDLADQPLKPDRTAARALCEDILAIAQGVSLQRSINLTADIPDPEFEIYGDRRGLKQVALNLLSNAIKFSAPFSTVKLRIAPYEDGAEIVISDDGPGISEPLLNKVFEPLQTIDPHHAGSGAGLGLWIAKRIVTAHRGTIDLTSAVGEGTTATVRIPGTAAIETRRAP